MGYLRTTLVSGGGSIGSGLPLNGGKSQVNLGGIQANGDYPFINMMKAAAAVGCVGITGGPPPDPDILDLDGYPTALTNGQGYDYVLFMPRKVDKGGEYILRWDGTGSFMDWTDVGITGGSLSSTGTGFCKGVPYADVPSNNFTLRITATSAAPNNVRNVRFYAASDATDFETNGEIFSKKLRDRIAEAKFGVIRFMDWQNNNTNNMAKWADNKRLTQYSYYASEFRGAAWGANKWYFGATTNVVNAYSITTTRGRAPQAGDIIQLKFNVDNGAVITAAVTSGANTVLTIRTSSTDNVFNTASESVEIYGVTGSWSGLNGIWTVQGTPSAGSVTVNFSSTGLPAGGLAWDTGTPAFPRVYHRTATLNVDGSGAVNILDSYSNALAGPGNSYPAALAYERAGSFNYATLVYASVQNAWIKQGGDIGAPASGLNNATPPQLGLQLATRVGAHPWVCMPVQALDPMTDYVTQCATYFRDNQPAWMVPRFEPPNESFNSTGGFCTNTALLKRSAVYGWPAADNSDYVHLYGKIASTIGQDLEAVYHDRTKYVFVAGGQTGMALGNSTNAANIFTSNLYVTQAAAAQSGYTKTAAKTFIHAIAPSNYYNPSAYQQPIEKTWADAYAGGDLTRVPAYIATCYGADAGLNLEHMRTSITAWKTLAMAQGVAIMEFYEGGFSPDFDGDPNTNALKTASLYHVNMIQLVLDAYAINTSLTGTGFTARFPSHYYFSANRWMHGGVRTAVWPLLDDIYETPTSAEWQGIVTYNT